MLYACAMSCRGCTSPTHLPRGTAADGGRAANSPARTVRFSKAPVVALKTPSTPLHRNNRSAEPETTACGTGFRETTSKRSGASVRLTDLATEGVVDGGTD